MPVTSPHFPSRDGKAVALNVADTDGVKTLIATSLAAQSYTGAALNGASMTGGLLEDDYAVSVTTTVDAAAYNTTNPIQVIGTHWLTGQQVTQNLTLTAAGGGETINGNILFKSGTTLTIKVPAQLTVNGEFTFGTTVAKSINPPCHALHAGTGGAIVVRLVDMDYNDTPLTKGANQYEDRAWCVAELHSGTAATGMNALYGTKQ